MTTLHSSFKLILVVKSFFSYNQKPEDTIQNTCSSAVSEEAHGRCLNRFIKLLQLKQVKQDGSCLFAIKKSFLGDHSLFLHSKRSSTKSGKGGTKTVKKQALQTERAAGTRYCAVRNNKELSLGEQSRKEQSLPATCQEARKAAAQRQNSLEGETSLHALAGSFISFLTVCLPLHDAV